MVLLSMVFLFVDFGWACCLGLCERNTGWREVWTSCYQSNLRHWACPVWQFHDQSRGLWNIQFLSDSFSISELRLFLTWFWRILQCCGFISQIPKRLLERSMPMLPKLNFPVIDVRDVARAHINAMTVPEAAGHRHILSNGDMWVKDIAKVCGKSFPVAPWHGTFWKVGKLVA